MPYCKPFDLKSSSNHRRIGVELNYRHRHESGRAIGNARLTLDGHDVRAWGRVFDHDSAGAHDLIGMTDDNGENDPMLQTSGAGDVPGLETVGEAERNCKVMFLGFVEALKSFVQDELESRGRTVGEHVDQA